LGSLAPLQSGSCLACGRPSKRLGSIQSPHCATN